MQTIQQPWTPKELEQLRALYPSTNNEDIALVINRSTSAIAHKAHRLKLRKSASFLESKLSGRFTAKKESWSTRLSNFLFGSW